MLSAFQFLFCFLSQVAEVLSALGLVPRALHLKPFLQEYTHARTHTQIFGCFATLASVNTAAVSAGM